MEMLVQIYIAAVNVIAFLAFGLDKWRAKRDAYRIPEKVLLGLAVLGGAIGAFCGMRCFRHKTKKAKFFISIPVLVCIQVVILVVVMTKFGME